MPKLVFQILICTLLAGCSLRTSPDRVDSAAKAAIQEQQPQLSQSNLKPGAPILVGWVDSFNDPVLTALVKEAQANNKDLAAAAGNLERAKLSAQQANSSLLPNVALSSSGTRSGTQDGSGTGLTMGLQVNWEADLWGRIKSSTRAAQAGVAAAEADLRYARHSLASGVTKTYFSAIDAAQKAAIANDTLEITQEILRIVRVKEENGAASKQDLALARADLASAKENLANIQGAQRNALRALELLLGRYPGADFETGKTYPQLPPPPTTGVPSEILERRPDLIAAERRVAAAFEATAQAKTARLPSLSLNASSSGASSALSSLLDPANLAWQAGASLLAPLFDGGVRRAEVKIATVAQEQALASYGAAALAAFSEVEQSLDQGLVLKSRLENLEEALTQSKEAYRIAKVRYREGESDLLNVLTLQQRLIGAQTNVATLHRLLLDQRVDLYMALGGAWNK